MENIEDFVTPNTAKLLKEKGFVGSGDIGCKCGFYSEHSDSFEVGKGIKTASGQEVGLVYDDLDNSQLRACEYLRPTLQTAAKWLRKTFNIFIQIYLKEYTFYGKNIYGIAIYKNGSLMILDDKLQYNTFNSVEDAMNTAIPLCLKYFI